MKRLKKSFLNVIGADSDWTSEMFARVGQLQKTLFISSTEENLFTSSFQIRLQLDTKAHLFFLSEEKTSRRAVLGCERQPRQPLTCGCIYTFCFSPLFNSLFSPRWTLSALRPRRRKTTGDVRMKRRSHAVSQWRRTEGRNQRVQFQDWERKILCGSDMTGSNERM